MATTAFDVREILKQKIDKDDVTYERKVKVIKAVTIGIDFDNSSEVSGRDKYIWVRELGLNGAVHQVFNPDRIPVTIDTPCILLYDPRDPFQLQVYSVDWAEIINISEFLQQNWDYGTHAPNHEWPDGAPGYDPMSVYPRAFAYLRTYPSSGMVVGITSHRYVHDGNIVTYEGNASVDLSSYVPSIGRHRFVVVSLDKDTNANSLIVGDSTSISIDSVPPYPTMPNDVILSAAVRLYSSQTSIVELDIVDLRMNLTTSDDDSLVTREELEKVYSELLALITQAVIDL